MRIVILAGALLAPIAAALAADEPGGVWGLQFGVPITSQLPACKSSSPVQPSRCFYRTPIIRDSVTLYENPNLGFYAWGNAFLVEDRVEGAMLYFKRYEFPKAEALLNARFGPPTNETSASYTSGAGARLTGRVLTWEWPSVQITLAEFAGNINDGTIHVTTAAYRDAKAGAIKKGADAGKSNF